jgi:pimeloyl-ACP methyl ester carboxylesterase
VRSSQLNLGPAERVSFDGPDGRVAALRAGPSDGPRLLLLPGYTGSKEDFGPVFAPLSEAGLCVVAIDLPGQFESDGPDDPAGYAPARLAGTVQAVAGELGASVHLLGHSFGGLVARAAVLAEPARFISLVLMDSGPAQICGRRRALIERLEPVFRDRGMAAVYAATEAAARTEPDYVPPSPELSAFLERRFLAGSPAMLQGMGFAVRFEADRVDELAACWLPTLVLFGEDDDAWPVTQQRDMAGRLGARSVAIPGAAHSPAVENPAASAAALIAFWRMCQPSPIGRRQVG